MFLFPILFSLITLPSLIIELSILHTGGWDIFNLLANCVEVKFSLVSNSLIKQRVQFLQDKHCFQYINFFFPIFSPLYLYLTTNIPPYVHCLWRCLSFNCLLCDKTLYKNYCYRKYNHDKK